MNAGRRLRARSAALAVLGGLAACSGPPPPGWSGYVEGEYLHIGAAVGGTIESVAVRDGDAVARGALLFRLDPVPEQAARDEAQAQLLGAQAAAADTTKGRRPDEIAVTQAQRAQAAAQAALARAALLRTQDLYAQHFVSSQALDDARSALAQADAQVAALDAQLAVARLLAMIGVFMVANLAVGFTFSTLARNQLQAVQMTFFFFLPSLLLSGFMFPFRGMPGWAQAIGELLPLTHFNRIVRGILLKGNGWAEVWPELWPMLAFMAAAGAIALKRYRQTLD